MRYFRYKNVNKNRENALKEQYLTLTENEKSIVRKKNFWEKFGFIVAFIILSSCLFVSVFFLKMIPNPSNQWLEVLVVFGKVVLFFVLLALSGFLTFAITYSLWKKADIYRIPKMKKEIFSKACKHLREYYKLQEPYMVTKCYNSTDKHFTNRDVCIFIADEELRITVDLIQGFLYGYKDNGCYAFNRDEIVLSKKVDNNLLIAELKVGDTVFLLGYRANKFIKDNFLQETVGKLQCKER